MNQIERRIDALEQRIGIVADGFAARLSEDDAGFYGAIMRRWAVSRQEFADFIRTLERDELERLLQLHIDGLAAAGIGLEDLDGLDAGKTGWRSFRGGNFGGISADSDKFLLSKTGYYEPDSVDLGGRHQHLLRSRSRCCNSHIAA